MPRKPLPDKGVQTSLRLPRELYDRLAAEAGEKGIGEEIRSRLEQTFAGQQEPVDARFDDLLSALRYAATAAARMFPARRVTVSRNLARQLGAEGQEVEDTTAQRVFGECLMTLLAAFDPVGVPDSLPKGHDAFQAELQRRIDRIVGAALGSLGDRGAEAFARLADIDQEGIAKSGPAGRRLAREAEKQEGEQ